jgi:hypothetical protein
LGRSRATKGLLELLFELPHERLDGVVHFLR